MRIVFVFILLTCLLNVSYAEVFSGKVITVLDGDTIQVLRNGRPVKVRLAGIDAPEMEQEFGMASKQSLTGLVLHKQVRVNTQAVDDYGRLVAEVNVGGLNINQEQVRRGLAWDYSRFHSNIILAAMENEAKAARRGLWAQSAPTPPRQWRKTHAAPSPQVAAQDAACGSKRRCSEMGSCVEAKFYLKHCGVKSLDGDEDGVPCESLCALKE